MNGLEIQTILKSDKHTKSVVTGVYSADKLPKAIKNLPTAFVANTDPSHKPGQHWIAVYISEDGNGEYFDSYGQPPHGYPEFVSFLRKNCTTWIYNSKRLQDYFSTVCGQYCLFYLLHRCRGWSLDTITGLFSNDRRDNDQQVNDFIREQFSHDLKVTDTDFVLHQISKALLH